MCTLGCFETPPTVIGGALPINNITLAIEGFELVYHCPMGYASKTGKTDFTLRCNASSWVNNTNIEEFQCLKGRYPKKVQVFNS